MNVEWISADWAMVWITVVYVIATCAICWANICSARASRAQLDESKKEHEESIRFSLMPFLQFEAYEAFSGKDYDFELDLPMFRHDSCDMVFAEIMRLTNIGNGAATNITYSWENKKHRISLEEAFRVNAVKANGEYNISLVFECNRKMIDSNDCYILTFHYDDMRGYTYNQRMVFKLYSNGENGGIAEISTDAPEYTGVKFLG